MCKDCPKRDKCKEPCKKLKLQNVQKGRLKGEYSISNDLLDKLYYKEKDRYYKSR